MPKIVRWLVFGVIISLVPILLVYTDLLLEKQPVTTEKLIGHGELIVIAWVLAAGAVGELIGSPAANPIAKIVFGGIALIVVIVATYYFGVVAEAQILATSPNAPADAVKLLAEKSATIVDYSRWFFIFSLIPSGICIACS
jgi:hypothetical protein